MQSTKKSKIDMYRSARRKCTMISMSLGSRTLRRKMRKVNTHTHEHIQYIANRCPVAQTFCLYFIFWVCFRCETSKAQVYRNYFEHITPLGMRRSVLAYVCSPIYSTSTQTFQWHIRYDHRCPYSCVILVFFFIQY